MAQHDNVSPLIILYIYLMECLCGGKFRQLLDESTVAWFDQPVLLLLGHPVYWGCHCIHTFSAILCTATNYCFMSPESWSIYTTYGFMDVRPLCHSNLQTRQLLFNEVVLSFFLLHFCDESCSLFGELLHVVYVILKQCVCGIKEKKRMRTTKYRAKPGDCTIMYLSSPFPGKQLFSPDWTPAWTDSFRDPSHSDTVRKQRWGEHSGIFKAAIQEAGPWSVTFLLVRDLTLVMAGRLRHIMFSGWVCLYLKLFFLLFFASCVSGSTDNKRKLRATPQWRYLKLVPEGNWIRAWKMFFLCVRATFVSTLSVDSFDVGLLLLLVSHSHLFISRRQENRPCSLR